jgi:hypothetical protein
MELESAPSVVASVDVRIGAAKSLSMEAESRLDGLGGSGLFPSESRLCSDVTGDIGGLETVMGRVWVVGSSNDGVKSENDTTCGPFGATALP